MLFLLGVLIVVILTAALHDEIAVLAIVLLIVFHQPLLDAVRWVADKWADR